MTTGILTFHDGINYGAFCQVYSLFSYLRSQGLDVQVLNYKNPGFEERERQCFILPGNADLTARNMRKMALFEEAHSLLNMTPRLRSQEDLARHAFDAVVVGSDEVWNFSTELIGFDPVYFSHGVQADRLVSYAPSFGTVNAGDAIPDAVCEGIRRFSSISVRDANASRVVQGITGTAAPIVLDPTFLTDLSAQAVLPEEKDYILVYGFFSPPMVESIRAYARKAGKKTVALGYYREWCDVNRDIITPFEWLGYFMQSDCVVTTMFHGMIYSILNRKPFCMFMTDYRRNKVGTLLDDAGLAHAIAVQHDDPAAVLNGHFDYAAAYASIDAKRAFSRNYLAQALGLPL
ncbi:MAG: polysaccharide pyruvyl transferase family protein [Halodesulfovibrio sp.]